MVLFGAWHVKLYINKHFASIHPQVLLLLLETVEKHPFYTFIYKPYLRIGLALVVQKLDSAIHRINHYPAEEYYGKQLCYPVDSDLSGG